MPGHNEAMSMQGAMAREGAPHRWLEFIGTLPQDEGSGRAASDRRLIHSLLACCLPWSEAAAVADALIASYGDLAEALSAPEDELRERIGLDGRSAELLRSISDVAARLAMAPLKQQPMLDRTQAVLDYLTIAYARERVEVFRVLFLNSKNRLIEDEVLGRGSVSRVSVYAREVIRRALHLHATALILVHNHPSGDPTPSDQDLEVTAELTGAAAMFDISVHDHLIIGRGRHCSFRQLGLIGSSPSRSSAEIHEAAPPAQLRRQRPSRRNGRCQAADQWPQG